MASLFGGSGKEKLLSLAEKGNWEKVESSLAKASKSTKEKAVQAGEDGSLLHIAAETNSRKGVTIVLGHLGNPNSAGPDGMTPLHVAARAGHAEICSVLLDADADPNLADKTNSLPIHYAAESNATSCVSILLSKGSDVDAKDKNGETPLHRAAKRGNHEVIVILVETGKANLDERAKWTGCTAFQFAVSSGSVLCCSYLKENGALVVEPDSRAFGFGSLRNSLHLASLYGLSDMVEFLVESAGFDPDSRDDEGNTPLHYVAKKGVIETVRSLLSLGASPLSVNNAGQTPQEVAIQAGHVIFANMLGTAARSDVPVAQVVRDFELSLESPGESGDPGDGPELLKKVLAQLRLEQFTEALHELGVQSLGDVLFVTEKDLEDRVGMKLVEVRKLHSACRSRGESVLSI